MSDASVQPEEALKANSALTGRAVAVGLATLVVAIAWRMAFQEWASESHFRYDIGEPFLHPWEGLTWITQAVLWCALIISAWPWIPLALVAVASVALQSWLGLGSAWIGVSDGVVTPLGALMALLSVAQLGLTAAWIVLIAISKRAPR